MAKGECVIPRQHLEKLIGSVVGEFAPGPDLSTASSTSMELAYNIHQYLATHHFPYFDDLSGDSTRMVVKEIGDERISIKLDKTWERLHLVTTSTESEESQQVESKHIQLPYDGTTNPSGVVFHGVTSSAEMTIEKTLAEAERIFGKLRSEESEPIYSTAETDTSAAFFIRAALHKGEAINPATRRARFQLLMLRYFIESNAMKRLLMINLHATQDTPREINFMEIFANLAERYIAKFDSKFSEDEWAVPELATSVGYEMEYALRDQTKRIGIIFAEHKQKLGIEGSEFSQLYSKSRFENDEESAEQIKYGELLHKLSHAIKSVALYYDFPKLGVIYHDLPHTVGGHVGDFPLSRAEFASYPTMNPKIQ